MSVHRPKVLSLWLSLVAFLPNPERLPAEVDDAYALAANPAGLGFVQGSDLRLLYTYQALDPADVRLHGLGAFAAVRVFDALTLGASYEDRFGGGGAEQRYRIGLAAPFGRLSLGASYDFVSPTAGLGRGAFTTGLSFRPWRVMALGVVVGDWAQSQGPRRYDLGLALRPGSDRLLLSADWSLHQGVRAFGREQHLAARAQLELIDGLDLGVGLHLDRSGASGSAFQLGVTGQLALSLGTMSVGSAVGFFDGVSTAAGEIAFSSPPRPSFLDGRPVAVIELEGDLEPDASFSLFSLSFDQVPFGRLPLTLDTLARGQDTRGLFVRIAPLSIGWGRAQEIRSLLAAYAATQRRVDCYLGGSGDVEYYVASACTEIIVVPAHQLQINGVAANALFLGETLDRFGLRAEAVARGRYKSAPDMLTRSGMSDAHRESLTAFLDRVYLDLVTGITTGRKLERAEVERLLAKGTLTSSEAISAKLVDASLYPDQIEDHIAEAYGRRPSFQPAEELLRPSRSWGRPPRIAIVNVDAEISGGESRTLPFGLGESAGAQTIVGALDAVRRDPSVGAIVLRVDSPGGDALASDLIARAVSLAAEAKPVVASFGDVAASGGYYVAAPAKAIYASPSTLTGSIGVFMLRVSVEGLLGKLGVGVESIERGPLSNVGSLYHDLSPEARASIEHGVDEAYAQFVQIVAGGRKLTREQVIEVAEGRIWSGADARAHGLVDEVGGLADAVWRARREAGVPDDVRVEVISLPIRRAGGLPSGLLSGAAAGSAAQLGHLIPHALREPLGFLLERAGDSSLVARLPFALDID